MAYYDQQQDVLGGINEFIRGLVGGIAGLAQGTPQFDYNQSTQPVVNAAPTWQQVFDQVYKARELGLNIDETQLDQLLGLGDDPRGSDYAHQFTSYGHPGRNETLTWDQLQEMGGISRDEALASSTGYADLLTQIANAERQGKLGSLADDFDSKVGALLSGPNGLDDLISRIQELGRTPVYDEGTITRLTNSARADTSLGAQNALQAVEQNLAARGVAGSGINTDLNSRVLTEGERSFSNIHNNILNEAQRTNRGAQESALAMESSLAGIMSQLGIGAEQFSTGLRSGAIASFDPSSIFNSLSQISQNSAYTDFLNQSLNAGAIQQQKADQQQMFDNMISLGGFFNSLRSGGGGGGGGSSGGGFKASAGGDLVITPLGPMPTFNAGGSYG